MLVVENVVTFESRSCAKNAKVNKHTRQGFPAKSWALTSPASMHNQQPRRISKAPGPDAIPQISRMDSGDCSFFTRLFYVGVKHGS